MLKRILMYLKDRRHDQIRRQKLFLWEMFRIRDNDFDYRKHLRGSFWDYVRGRIGQRADLTNARKLKTVNDYRKATKGL